MKTQTRTLTISIESDLDADMAQFAASAKRGVASGQYQGETLNFATPATFFRHLSAHRWNLLTCLLEAGTLGVRELARRVGRDVKRVHADAGELVRLGLLEKTAQGALHCPYGRIDIDMELVPRTLPDTLTGDDAVDVDIPVVHPVVAQRAMDGTRHSARRHQPITSRRS